MFQQVDNPLGGSLLLSGLAAALPLLTLFVLLVSLRWKAAASEGAAFGSFPIVWIVPTAIWIFRMTQLTGCDLVRRRVTPCRSAGSRRPGQANCNA